MEKKHKDLVVPYTKKYVPLRDFIYLCIILTIVAISLITMVLSDSTRAGENLNFAATVVSIVLAILAIVITLTDSSGQKESIRKLEDVADVMEDSVNKTQHILRQSLDKSEEHIKALINLKDDLKSHYEESISQLRDNLYQAFEGDNANVSKEDIDKIIEKSLNELKESLSKNRKTTDFDININDIAVYMSDKYSRLHFSEYMIKEDFEEFIMQTLVELGFENNSLKVRANKMFNYLVSNNHFYYVESERGFSTLPF